MIRRLDRRLQFGSLPNKRVDALGEFRRRREVRVHGQPKARLVVDELGVGAGRGRLIWLQFSRDIVGGGRERVRAAAAGSSCGPCPLKLKSRPQHKTGPTSRATAAN